MWVNMVPGRWSQNAGWGHVEGWGIGKTASTVGVNEQVTVQVTGTHNHNGDPLRHSRDTTHCCVTEDWKNWSIYYLPWLRIAGGIEGSHIFSTLHLHFGCTRQCLQTERHKNRPRWWEQSTKSQLHSHTSHEVSNATPFYRLGKWDYLSRVTELASDGARILTWVETVPEFPFAVTNGCYASRSLWGPF